MEDTEIIQELEKIKKIAGMTHEDIYKRFPEMEKYVTKNDSIYPCLTGLMEAELDYLIAKLRRG